MPFMIPYAKNVLMGKLYFYVYSAKD